MSEISTSLSLLRLLSLDRAESTLRDSALIDRSGAALSLGISRSPSVPALREEDDSRGELFGLRGEDARGEVSVAASILGVRLGKGQKSWKTSTWLAGEAPGSSSPLWRLFAPFVEARFWAVALGAHPAGH